MLCTACSCMLGLAATVSAAKVCLWGEMSGGGVRCRNTYACHASMVQAATAVIDATSSVPVCAETGF